MKRHKYIEINSWDNLIKNSEWITRWDGWLPNKILRESWLPELDSYQISIVEDVHLIISKWLYQNDNTDLLHISRVMRQAWISKEQTRVLIESGITS